MMISDLNIPKMIIVGGGAGGLELAAKLGRKLGRRKKAHIILIDSSPTHIWKPLLHEIAAGTINSFEDELNYMAFARDNHFQFILGTLQSLHRAKKEIVLSTVLNGYKNEIIPQRTLSYDALVIAVGSVANDFGIPGVREHCLFLDNRHQADFFQQQLITHLMRLSCQPVAERVPLEIAVVGGGATGIELVAELHNAVQLMAKYGFDIAPKKEITFSLIESSEQLLPALSQHLSKIVVDELKRLGVKIYTGERVNNVTVAGFSTQSGKFIPATLKIWTAGIKAPDFLTRLDGLETNRQNQLQLKQTLQTTLDDAIFAIGDCASCPQTGGTFVPPRAQSAHQQANFLVHQLPRYFSKKPLANFKFHDYGSLITLSHYETVGKLMGIITKSFMVEGKIARLAYLSLYRKHQAALYGMWRVMLLTIANFLTRHVRPRLKLH